MTTSRPSPLFPDLLSPDLRPDRPAKADTLLDYGRRLDRVVRHIAAHLDDPLDLDELAAVACFSPYHFHRIYRAMTGETVTDTLRRQRLHRAAGALVQDTRMIAAIARQAGYGSVAAFTRAFAQSYGVTPAAYRRSGRLSPFAWPHDDRPNQNPEDIMLTVTTPTVTIETLPATSLIGFDHRGPYMEINAAFSRAYAWAAGRNLMTPATRCIGVYFDDPSAVAPEDLRSFAGLALESAPALEDGAKSLDLPGGRHAVLVHKGPYAALGAVYQWLYGEWLPASGQTPADQPCFEEYLNDPRSVPPEEWLTRICVPLM